MKTIYNDLMNSNSRFEWMVEDYPTSLELTKRINEQLEKYNYKTPSGKRHYYVVDAAKMRGVYEGLKARYEHECTEFGYWYNGEFYSTKKTSTHKSTNVLFGLNLSQDQWDSLDRQIVHSDNLKAWF